MNFVNSLIVTADSLSENEQKEFSTNIGNALGVLLSKEQIIRTLGKEVLIPNFRTVLNAAENRIDQAAAAQAA